MPQEGPHDSTTPVRSLRQISVHRDLEVCFVGENNFHWVSIVHITIRRHASPDHPRPHKKKKKNMKHKNQTVSRADIKNNPGRLSHIPPYT
jgi:hypothetical protein